MQLDDVIEAIEDAMKQIDEDERFHYEPANVFSNAVLALIQADLGAQMRAYKQVLFMLRKIRNVDVESGNKVVISSTKTRETEDFSFFETSIETSFCDGNEAFKHMVQYFFTWLKQRQEVPYEAVTTLLDEVYFGGKELKLGDAVEVKDAQ